MIDGIVMKGKRMIILFSIAETNSTVVSWQLHGYREDEAFDT